MSLAVVRTRSMLGIEALEVAVEVHLSNGLPGFAIVGMPETAVRESKERVRSAIINSGLEFPNRRITVNLAPADLPKQGCSFDLAIALGILVSSKQIPARAVEDLEVFGELSLDGKLRSVCWSLPFMRAANRSGRWALLAAPEDRESLRRFINKSRFAGTLSEAISLLLAEDFPSESEVQEAPVDSPGLDEQCDEAAAEVNDPIKGQALAKQAIELAALGGHSLLFIGPPGCGKTLLINRLHRLLPRLNVDEAEQLAVIRSAAGESQLVDAQLRPPMRTPHHSVSAAALVGGGSNLRPGEVSLAHHGLLFLDELAQFKPAALDGLREPLETGRIHVARANYRVELPAKFQLVAAMNPCPCGHYGNPLRQCRCPLSRIESYQQRLSGPLIDRFDIVLELPALNQAELLSEPQQQWNPVTVCQNVASGRAMQRRARGSLNAKLAVAALEQHCPMNAQLRMGLARSMEKLRLSARATHRVIRLSRTIADLEGSKDIGPAHLANAISLRRAALVCR